MSRRWVIQGQCLLEHITIYRVFNVSELILITPTSRVIMPWRQISHLPADQSHKEPTGNSPWPMSCSSYWFLPPNHLHAMLGTSQCWEHRNGENIAEHITLQPGKTRNVDNITTLWIIGIQGHKSDNLSSVYMVTNAMFGITKILHPTLPTSQCREHYRVHSVMPSTLFSSPNLQC